MPLLLADRKDKEFLYALEDRPAVRTPTPRCLTIGLPSTSFFFMIYSRPALLRQSSLQERAPSSREGRPYFERLLHLIVDLTEYDVVVWCSSGCCRCGGFAIEHVWSLRCEGPAGEAGQPAG